MRNNLLAAVLGLATATTAQLAQKCPDSGLSSLCYSVNIPETSASKDAGDIYFQIKGPETLQWMALGQGNQMAGANIFVVYADAAKTNVTLSPRLGLGHVEPQDTGSGDAQLTLLAGSGISNGVMTANVRCASCNTWSGGQMSFTSSSSNWIWAYKEGDSLASNSVSASINQHDEKGTFQLDLTTAKGGSSQNPFVIQGKTPAATASAGAATATSSASASSASASGGGGGDDTTPYDIAHGIIMGLTFVVLFPCGALIRRVAPRSSIWLHAGFQLFSYVLAIAGLGLGVQLALETQQMQTTHAYIGLIVVCVLALQPILGLLQHAYYKKNGRRGVFGSVHIVLGTSLIVLGIVNGGLGLQLAGPGNKYEIAYAVVAAVLVIIYMAIIMGTLYRPKGGVQGKSG